MPLCLTLPPAPSGLRYCELAMNALWMLLACFMFATMGAFVKLVTGYFNVGQTVLIRGLMPILLIGLWILWRRASLRTPHWRSHLYRSGAGGTAMLMYFGAITLLPLACAVTLNNTSALFMAAMLSLRQRPSRSVLAGLGLGLVGVILVMKPDFSPGQWFGALLGLCSAGLACVAQLNLRDLGRAGEPEWRTVFILSLVMSLLAAPLALHLPARAHEAGPLQWLLLLGIGFTGGIGQLALTRAFSRGKAIVTASLGYSTVVFSSLYGMLIWDEHLDPLAWLGMLAIVAAGLLTTRPSAAAATPPGKPEGAIL
ncbi:MAG: DMT family transporter [Candidatus Dactylopiibacterium sp.]|nr:DMT family transporter [Candidatus Dactylopiibacterium sp.]